MNGMTAKELEQEKLTVNRMCLELKAKRQVSRNRPAGEVSAQVKETRSD